MIFNFIRNYSEKKKQKKCQDTTFYLILTLIFLSIIYMAIISTLFHLIS